ncbi:MAG: T9SS type A sorting domain-containing protein [Microbacter sp.]
MKHHLLSVFFIIFMLITSTLRSEMQRAAIGQANNTPRITLLVNDARVLTVVNAPINALVQIYSLVGSKVAEKRITSNRQEFALDLPVGYYIVRIGDQTQKITIR